MSEVGAEIIKTKETKENGIKYLNINVSNSEVDRNPDIVRLCANVGIEEYVKPKTGHWIEDDCGEIECSCCHHEWSIFDNDTHTFDYCPSCGAKMVEPQESDLGDYPDAIHNQFDNMTGSMNL